jgi:hypothetical protein
VLGLLRLARGVRHRWRPLLAGGVLSVVGWVLRGDVWGIAFVAGLWFLVYALLIPAVPEAGREQHAELARQLAAYSTPGQRSDLEATLDRYPDSVTRELREILASQAVAVGHNGIPGAGRLSPAVIRTG